MGVDSISVPIRIKPFFAWIKKINWFGLLIAASFLFLLTYTLGESYWVRVPPPLFLVTILAVINGWLLSKTRWSMGWSVAYSLLMALSFGIQYVGKIIPSLSGVKLYNWLETANWQIFLILERTNQWLQSIQNQRIIYDEGFWEIVLIALVWVSTSWLVICLNRGKNLWMAILPLIGSIALSIQNDRNDVLFLLAALFLGIVLVTHGHYSRSEKIWQQRRIDFPEQLWVEWYVAAVVIGILVLFTANLAPTITTPEGWREIRIWVEEMKEPESSSENDGGIEGYVFRPPMTRDERLLLLQPLDLSRVGTPLPHMEGTIMWVRTGDVTPRPWRMAIYNTYTGSGWLEAELDEQSDFQVEETPTQGRKALYQRFTLFRAGDGRIFAAGEPVQALSENVRLVPLMNDDSQIVTGYAQHYEVISWVPDLSAEMLKTASGEIPALIQAEYLQLPERLPPRVRNLAARLVEGQDTVYERVIKVQEYVRQSVPYDLESGPPESDQDVVDYFLFEANSGFCTYYASAMAVLLRIEGIPARLVTGYAPGVFMPEQGNFEVTGDLAHAWVEVYFPGYGWIPFEPTPSQSVPSYSFLNSDIAEVNPQIPGTRQANNRWVWLQVFFGGLIVCVVVWVGWLLVKFFRSRQQEKKMALHPAAKLYRRMRIQLANTGISAAPSVTPREFLELSGERLEEYPKLHMALKIGTDTFEKSEFSLLVPNNEELDNLRTTIKQANKEKVLLRIDHQMKKFSSKAKIKRGY
jgi:transglutaminase-like putative cysteine protease